MPSETRKCQNCKQDFVIEPDDFAFYEKMKVPAPTWCPECRAQRRLVFRNERVFYKRKCDRCNKDVVSMYSPNKPYTVWCYDCWFSDDWDPVIYGRNYDPSRPFFEQLNDLLKTVPKIALIHVRSVNSDYANISADNKNCYMIVESSNNEDCSHCYWIQQCKNCVDVSFSDKVELSYETDGCYNSYKLFYSKWCKDCHDSYFLVNCRGCADCIGCVNLVNKQYHVFNEPFSKEDYKKFLDEARLDTHDGVEKLRARFSKFLKTQPKKYAEIVNSPRSTGSHMRDAKNCRSCFHCYDAEDCKYGVHIWRNAKDCMDGDTIGRNAELIYNSINTAIDSSRCVGCSLCWTCSFLQYCHYCFNSSNCFGCVGLRKKDYSILNKQYDKETFQKISAQIIEDMKKQGEYGEFLPAGLSAFGYNESAALEQFPLSEKQAVAKGFKWENHARGIFDKETLKWKDVPESINDFKADNVEKEIFSCINCKKNYRFIASEFAFYKKLEIPLPRFCPDCRHERRFEERGPNRLWHRKCMCDNKNHSHKADKCLNEFETPYAPDRPEIVYCEQCYQAEVA